MSVLFIRILCSVAGVLATDLPCLQTRILIAHSNHSISLQLHSLTYTRPQAPIIHELSLGGPSFLLHSVQLVDVYKSENLIGGKYCDSSVLKEFGFEDMVNRLLRHPQWSKVFEWRGPTYTPVTYEFLA